MSVPVAIDSGRQQERRPSDTSDDEKYIEGTQVEVGSSTSSEIDLVNK